MNKEIYAKQLLKTQAVYLRPEDPFIWASGIKSPIYCDNRILLAYPESRTIIEKGLEELVKEIYPEVDVLMGTATAGIAHAAIVANNMGIPMGYVRSSEKTHGRNNKIEGKLTPGDKVVVIEDLISTGGSSIEVVKALEEVGAIVLGVISIFTYNIKKGFEKFKEANVEYHSLSDIDCLLEVAVADGYIDAAQAIMVKKFRDNL